MDPKSTRLKFKVGRISGTLRLCKSFIWKWGVDFFAAPFIRIKLSPASPKMRFLLWTLSDSISTWFSSSLHEFRQSSEKNVSPPKGRNFWSKLDWNENKTEKESILGPLRPTAFPNASPKLCKNQKTLKAQISKHLSEMQIVLWVPLESYLLLKSTPVHVWVHMGIA